MNTILYLLVVSILLSSCSSVQKLGLKTSKNTRVIQYEPAVNEASQSFYQFEDQNYYYAFYLLPKEQKEAASVLDKITTNPEQKIEINYYKGGGTQACLKSIKIEGKTFDIPKLTNRCDLYVSFEKDDNGYNHIRMPKPRLTSAKIKQFLRKNPKLKEYLPLITVQALKPGMPLNLLFFMWGNPESKFSDEENTTLYYYNDWYVSVRDNKVFSFSSRDQIPEYPSEE